MKRFVLTLPDDLHAALKALTEREERSLHGQLLYILRQYLRQLEKQD